MAIKVEMELGSGLTQEDGFYWRFNHFSFLPNRNPDGSRPAATAWFRAYLSEQHFKDEKGFIEEKPVQFVPKWEQDIRAEAYEALKNLDVSAEAEAALQARDTLVAVMEEHRAAAAETARLRKALEELPDEASKAAGSQIERQIEEAATRETAAEGLRDQVRANVDQADAALDAVERARDAFTLGKDV